MYSFKSVDICTFKEKKTGYSIINRVYFLLSFKISTSDCFPDWFYLQILFQILFFFWQTMSFKSLKPRYSFYKYKYVAEAENLYIWRSCKFK